MKSKKLIFAVALIALALTAPAAHADHVRPNLGIDVISVDPATRTVEGIQHCTSPERAGTPAKFTVSPDIALEQFMPGARWGIAVGANNVILSTGPMPCTVGPPPPGAFPPPPGPGGPGPEGLVPPDGEDGLPAFSRGFMNRVWKFQVEVDSFEAGKLEVTIGKVLNLPKKFSRDDDDLLDEAAIVLINKKARVYDGSKRVPTSRLDDVDGNVRVQGKLLPPDKWQEDEDGDRVATIRATKVYI